MRKLTAVTFFVSHIHTLTLHTCSRIIQYNKRLRLMSLAQFGLYSKGPAVLL